MDSPSMHFNEQKGRQRLKDCHCYPKKIYLRVIVPAPKEHFKCNSNPSSCMSSIVPRRYTMVAKEMSFELGKIIRYDTYGEVRLAHSTTSSKTIAVKCIRKDHPQMQGYVKYILPREIALLKMLKGHPNVISFIGVLDANHYAMVATEHVEGMSLLEFIRKKHSIREDEARVIFRELLNTVITCHSLGISIRGLTCENVLLDKSLTPKISTFEHAIVRGYDKVDIFEGTNCSPPEVFEGMDYDSKVVDVWTLGVILYTMVTGTQPCSEENLDRSKKFSLTFPAYMSSHCRKVIEKMLHPSPRKRISISELKRDEWLNDLTLRSVEYQLAYDTDINSDNDANPRMKSAEVKAMHARHSRAQRCTLEDCDYCKSCFNMKNVKNMESVELVSGDNAEKGSYSTAEEEDSFCSRKNVQYPYTNKAMMRERKFHEPVRKRSAAHKKSRSFSTGRSGYIQLGKTSPRNHDLRSSKSMESISVVANNSDTGEFTEGYKAYNGAKRASYTDIDIDHFLSEEKKHLADTNIVLAEEKRFLDIFAKYLRQEGNPCAATSISGINIAATGQQLNKSTSCSRNNHINRTTSCSARNIGTSRNLCDAGVDAVVATANQVIQWTGSGLIKPNSDTPVPELRDSKEGPCKTTSPAEAGKNNRKKCLVHNNVEPIVNKAAIPPIMYKWNSVPVTSDANQQLSSSSESESKPPNRSEQQHAVDQTHGALRHEETSPAIKGIHEGCVSSLPTQMCDDPKKQSAMKKMFSFFKPSSSSDSPIRSFLKRRVSLPFRKNSKNQSYSTQDSSDNRVHPLSQSSGSESTPQKSSKCNKQKDGGQKVYVKSEVLGKQSSWSSRKRNGYHRSSKKLQGKQSTHKKLIRNVMWRTKSSPLNPSVNRGN